MIAGCDIGSESPEVYGIDEFCSLQLVETHSVQGYGIYVLLSLLDRKHTEKNIREMDIEEVKSVIQSCWQLIEQQTVLGKNAIQTYCASKDGVSRVDINT
jgi:hypothetical protein